jgi:hypothetical protein
MSPSVIQQPKNRIVAVGGQAKFTVGASGAPALRYQWAKNGVNIAGAKDGFLPDSVYHSG